MDDHENADDAPSPERDRREKLLLLGTLRSVSVIGLVVVLTACLFLGAALLLDRYLPLGRAGVAVAVAAGVLAGLYWAFRRVEKVLRQFFPPAADAPAAPDGAAPPPPPAVPDGPGSAKK